MDPHDDKNSLWHMLQQATDDCQSTAIRAQGVASAQRLKNHSATCFSRPVQVLLSKKKRKKKRVWAYKSL